MNAHLTDALTKVSAAKPALADDHGTVDHGQLRLRSMQAARRLHHELGGGQFIVIRAEHSSDFVVTFLGAIYSGNTPVPIDPQTPERALTQILARCEARPAISPLRQPEYSGLSPLAQPDKSRPAMVMFTSGTTGTPKGVIMTHENIAHSCKTVAAYLGYAKRPSTLVALPLYYSYGLISQLLAQLYIGGYARLLGGLGNPTIFIKSIQEEKIQTFCGVPSTFLTLHRFSRLRPFQLPSVQVVCSAGAAFDLSLYDEIRTIFPNAQVFNNYGMTEACPRISFISDDDPRFLQGTCGRTMAGVQAVIVDEETGHRKPDGEKGMLAVRGPNITPGYLHDDQRTCEAFTAEGFLKTGDLAYLDNGYIYLHGRVDDVFNVAGEKVSPLEIEAALNTLPEIECAAVRGMPDTSRGGAPVAFLILREKVSKERLDIALSEQLSPIRIPVAYYQVSELPLTNNGKVQRQKLAVDGSNILTRID